MESFIQIKIMLSQKNNQATIRNPEKLRRFMTFFIFELTTKRAMMVVNLNVFKELLRYVLQCLQNKLS